MAQRPTPVLHRDDPAREPLGGNVKVTREDWLNVALDVLVSDGVEQVKVLGLADRLGVSRSSFYWYFRTRQELLDALLDHWEETNTAALVATCQRPAASVTEAVCNVFRCMIDPAQFDTALDFTIRDWARRSGTVRRVMDRSDTRRLAALTALFEGFGMPPSEAKARARILYYMQIGYSDADLREPMAERIAMLPAYILGFTGQHPKQPEIDAFAAFAMALERKGTP